MLEDLGEEKSANVRFKMWLENIYGKKIPSKPFVSTYEFKDAGRGWGEENFVSQDALYTPHSEFVVNDIVFVCCEILRIKTEQEVLSASETKLREKFFSFYTQGITGDCILETEEQSFTVSKPMLMAHSEVFERLFIKNMQDSCTDVAKVEGASPKVVEQFIKYLHLNKLEDLDLMAHELFILSDRYAVCNLKADCVKSLSKSLEKGNILDRLRLAFVYNDQDLKNFALSYITDYSSEGNFHYVLLTDEWQKLANVNKPLTDAITTAIFEMKNWF